MSHVVVRLAPSATRAVVVAGLVAVVGLLPWLADRDVALSVLRARAGERDPTPEALAAIRAELGLDAPPVDLFARWLGGVVGGDLGRSWVSGDSVVPGVAAGVGVSATLMAAALAVALPVAVALCAPTLVRGVRGRPRAGGGAVGAVLAAVPEFVLATVLLLVGAVWLGWFPPYGWQGPQHLVLPALALGLPAGAVLGRVAEDALAPVFGEPWVVRWRAWGYSGRVLAGAAVRRALPSVLPQAGLVAVGLTGGAVAVEAVFAVPGLGRSALSAAKAQDLPVLQGCVLALVVLGAVCGAVAALVRRRMLGPALRAAALPASPPLAVGRPGRGRLAVVAVSGALLAGLVAWGLSRDPLRLETSARLAAPGGAYPLGADSLGRDVLARVGHGAAATLGTAVLVAACSCAVALLLGLLPGVARAAAEVVNAVPPVIAGLLVAGAMGTGETAAAVAVAVVSWPALAAHAASLVEEARGAEHLVAQRAMGADALWTLTRHVLPVVVGPVARHAVLRLPGVVLALASLGFLGLGAPPPTPEWGAVLAESLPYVERAPWATAVPAGALALVAVFAVGVSTLVRRR